MKRKELRRIIESVMREIDFANDAEFQKYSSQHKMRPDTQVTVAGKKMSVRDASSKNDTDMEDRDKRMKMVNKLTTWVKQSGRGASAETIAKKLNKKQLTRLVDGLEKAVRDIKATEDKAWKYSNDLDDAIDNARDTINDLQGTDNEKVYHEFWDTVDKLNPKNDGDKRNQSYVKALVKLSKKYPKIVSPNTAKDAYRKLKLSDKAYEVHDRLSKKYGLDNEGLGMDVDDLEKMSNILKKYAARKKK